MIMRSSPESTPSQPARQQPYRMGERVALGGHAGVIVAAFPDGFHLVRLDESSELTGAHFTQLVSIDDEVSSSQHDAASASHEGERSPQQLDSDSRSNLPRSN
jgi:hypothetical protein